MAATAAPEDISNRSPTTSGTRSSSLVAAQPPPTSPRSWASNPVPEVVIRRRNLFDKDTAAPEEIGASYLPTSLAGGTFLEEPTVAPKALFLCVEDLTGHRYTRARDQWIARMPTAEESVILELPTGAPVMHVVHTARDEHGTILEISESVWPADRVIVIDDYDIEQEPTKPEVPSEI